MTLVFFLVVLLPLLAACLAGHGRARGLVWLALPWLPLPALLMAALVSDARVDVPWLLQGARWQIDALRVPFLAAAALLWSAAGLYARGYQSGDARAGLFLVCWCLCLAGNLWLILAGDAAGFYAGFALMTFAAWGLVVHARSARALQAGRVYISMALLGELAMLAGLLLASEAADGSMVLSDMAAAIPDAPHQGWIVALLVAGFGVKAGLPVLHFWLPLAHPVAPTPASAVLSGAMIKAGLLGWLFLLPLGLTELPGWGALLMALGLHTVERVNVGSNGGCSIGILLAEDHHFSQQAIRQGDTHAAVSVIELPAGGLYGFTFDFHECDVGRLLRLQLCQFRDCEA